MKFIEMSGAMLREVVSEDEIPLEELRNAGVEDGSIVRVNQQGDIEIRRPQGWDVIGGLLGEFAQRVTSATGLDWA
ncbi:MAG: hypothetical protein WBF93_06740 [Pirellulales bacterium]